MEYLERELTPNQIKEALLKTCQEGNYKLAEEILESCENISTILDEESKVVNLAVSQSNKDMVKLFLKYGAPSNLKGENGDTPLHVAIKLDNFELVDILASEQNVMECFNQQGNMPIHTASSNGNAPIVRLLLRKGANPNLVNLSNKL